MATDNKLNLLTDLIGQAQKKGADAAAALISESQSLAIARRLGEPEHVERAEEKDISLRVYFGKSQASASSSDTSANALEELVDRVIAMARAVPEDPYCGLADPDQLATTIPDVDSEDPSEPSAEHLGELAQAAEDAAMAVEGVTNSEGGHAGWGRSEYAVAASNGFAQVRAGSYHSISASVLAGEGTAMERDYDYHSAVYAEDLRDAAAIGRSAGEKTVARLNPRKVESAQVPIIYDPRVSRSLVGHLAGAINGSSIARGTSFLKDKMGEALFDTSITIVDDPHRKRGLRSRPFDGDGLATRKMNVVEGGKLTTWFLDLKSARQLGLDATGHAGMGGGAGPSNLYLEPGAITPMELMADIDSGFYITELIGMGVNGVTGDYSRGATGFWIENGQISYPVSEVTIAGNLIDIFAHMSAANDLEFRYGTDAPTVRVDGMTVAGT